MSNGLRCQLPVYEPIQRAFKAINDIESIFNNFISYKEHFESEFLILFSKFKVRAQQVFIYCRNNGIDLENEEDIKHIPEPFNSLSYPILNTARDLEEFKEYILDSLKNEFNNLKDYT